MSLRRELPQFFATERRLAMDVLLHSTPITVDSPHPTMKRLAAAVGLVALVIIPVVLLVLLQRAANTHTLRKGDAVPKLKLISLKSNEVSLEGFGGKQLALLFFSVDCPHCQKEISNFERLQKLFAEKITFLSVSLNERKKTEGYLKAHGLTVETLLDEQGEARRAFGIDEIPALFLVDGDLTVKHREIGEGTLASRVKLLTAFGGDGVP